MVLKEEIEGLDGNDLSFSESTPPLVLGFLNAKTLFFSFKLKKVHLDTLT